MELHVQNRKYFKAFDDSDNSCCWQIELVGDDVEAILKRLGIKNYWDMYEDWGAAYMWKADGFDYSIHFECSDVDKAQYYFLIQGFRKKWLLFNEAISDEEMARHPCVAAVQALDEGVG
jgi:hypothetical protein